MRRLTRDQRLCAVEMIVGGFLYYGKEIFKENVLSNSIAFNMQL